MLLQRHPHLEDGSVYRQLRPTTLDEIKNFHSTDTIDTENSGTRGRPIWVHSSQVGRIDNSLPHNWVCRLVREDRINPPQMGRGGLHAEPCSRWSWCSNPPIGYSEVAIIGTLGLSFRPRQIAEPKAAIDPSMQLVLRFSSEHAIRSEPRFAIVCGPW